MKVNLFAQNSHLEKIAKCGVAKLTDYNCFEHWEIEPSSNPYKWIKSEYYNVYEPPIRMLYSMHLRGTTAYLIVKDDSLVYEKYFYGYNRDSLMNSFSMAKTITAILVGIAIDKGFISSVDDPVIKYLPEYPNLGNKLTIRNLLTMSSGLSWSEAFIDPLSDVITAYYTDNLDIVLKRQKVVIPPGKKWKYQCGNVIILALIVQKATGMPLGEFIQKYLWQPIGASHKAYWNKDTNNITKAFCCFYATPRDFALIGLMLLHKGFFNGQRILSEQFINQMITPANNLKYTFFRNVDFYGYLTWIYPKQNDIFYLAGLMGQYVIILPKQNAVIVRLGEFPNQLLIRRIPPDFPFYLKVGNHILEQITN